MVPLSSWKLFMMMLLLVKVGNAQAEDRNDNNDGVAADRQALQKKKKKKMPPIPTFFEWNQQHETIQQRIRKNKENNDHHELLLREHSNNHTRHEGYDIYRIDPDRNMTKDITRRRKLQDFCVTTEPELRMSISVAPNFVPTRIDICTPTMLIDASGNNPIYQGINIQNTNLDIRCNTTTPRCILDAQGRSRHFYASQTTVTFRDIVFLNGNSNSNSSTKQGGSIWAVQQSNLIFERCQFRNNIAGTRGGAIYSDSSNLTFVGGNVTDPTLFESNTCPESGGAIYARGRNPNITAINGSFVFRNNTAGEVRMLFIRFDHYHFHLNIGIRISQFVISLMDRTFEIR
jgi:predicted outer membrane repeat protein